MHARGCTGGVLALRSANGRKGGGVRGLCAAEGDGWGWRDDTVEYGDVVKVHYTGFLEDGTEFENTREKEPLEFQVGSGRVVPGIDAAMVGMVRGERQSVTVLCEGKNSPNPAICFWLHFPLNMEC